jgi:hypothetical protein
MPVHIFLSEKIEEENKLLIEENSKTNKFSLMKQNTYIDFANNTRHCLF